jgi:hypothetical protein
LTNDSITLYVQPRTSLAFGERTTIYIRYSTPKTEALQALPQYADYADEVELRFHVPLGSEVLRASPEPSRKGPTIYYVFHHLSRLQNPVIIVDITPPSAPLSIVMVAGIAGTAVVVLGVVVSRRLVTRRATELEVDVKPFKELFDGYADIAQRVWRTHEDYLRGKVKESTYRRRVQELRSAYLEALTKLAEASKRIERHPRLGKVARRISELVSKASKLEEGVSALEAMRQDKKITTTEVSQKVNELVRQIEELRKELHDLASRIGRAIT